MFRNKIFAAVGLGAAAVLALGTGSAFAAPASHPDAVHAQSNGTAGIESLHGNQIRNIAAQMVAQPAFENIGGLGQGGAGVQLCDPDNGFGLQVGLVSNGSTDTVDYALGTLTGAASRKCEGNGVLPVADAHTLGELSGIGIGDTVDVYAEFHNVFAHWTNSKGKHRSGWRGRARFEAADITTGDLYTSPWYHTSADDGLVSGGAGLEQDTQLISANSPTTPEDGYISAAENPAIVFCHVRTDTRGMLEYGSGEGLTVTDLWNDVYTSAGGLSANPALVATNDTLTPGTQSSTPSSFTVFVGNPVG
jgi:hypothetical protein